MFTVLQIYHSLRKCLLLKPIGGVRYDCMRCSATGGIYCPSDWIKTDTDCYFVSDTEDPAELLTWSEAKAKCSERGYGYGHLITIDDVNDEVTYRIRPNYSPYKRTIKQYRCLQITARALSHVSTSL